MILRIYRTSRRRLIAFAFAVLATAAIAVNAPEGHAGGQSCPSFGSVQDIGNLAKYAINEGSGLVASRTHSNRYWIHNDSGDSARIFAMTADGSDRGTVNLGGISAKDFEDIGIGPGPVSGKHYLYIADIGNNNHTRATLAIHRILEPTPPGAGKSITIPKDKIDTFIYAYENPNSPGKTWRRNAETLFVDPRSGDVVIVEKQLTTVDGKSDMGWVYEIDKSKLVKGSTILAKPRVAIKQRRSTSYGPMTGGDISPDGSVIVVKNGAETFAWKRASGQSVFAAFGAYPVTDCIAPKTPGEAIAFTPNSGAFLSVKEARHAPVYKVGINGSTTATTTTTKPPTTTTKPPTTTTKPPTTTTKPPYPTCDGRRATITGTGGDDLIYGTDGPDVIVGYEGNDTIYGMKGDDVICGGPGRDRLYGNVGHDRLFGGDHSDVLFGGYGHDFIVGSKGHDRMYGMVGKDYIAGAYGDDKLVGGYGDDELQAGDGSDSCVGGRGDDDYFSCEEK